MWVVELHYTLILDKCLIPLVTVWYMWVEGLHYTLTLDKCLIPPRYCMVHVGVGITLYINTR